MGHLDSSFITHHASVHHCICQRSKSGDGDGDGIARFQEEGRVAEHADAAGGSGGKDVAGKQGHGLRQVGDEIWNFENEIERVGLLHGLPV